jgi:queuine tRNA-ribosyltransferase
MELTVRWARRAHAHFTGRMQERAGRHALFPIVQGSMFAALRRDCARQLVELDTDGYAIGGLSVGEPRALSLEMTEATAPLLPSGRPRYVMGVGAPEELPEYVARGVDMMDCVMPSRNARNGCLFTSAGKVLIKQARFRDDARPLDPDCSCYTCRTFTRAYLRHLFIAGELLFFTLATLHNLARYLDIMRRMREAILLGRFPEYLTSARAWPALAE